MEVTWRLRMAAAQREVWTGSALRRLLAERAGVNLSPASVLGAADRPTTPAQAVHPGCPVHRLGVRSGGSHRSRHHPGDPHCTPSAGQTA